MIKTKIEAKEFERFLKRYKKHAGITHKELVIDLAQRGAKKLASYTEPRGLGKKKAGGPIENAIERDIHKIYPNVGTVANKIKEKSRRAAAAFINAIHEGRIDEADKLARKYLSDANKAGWDGGSSHGKQRNNKGVIARSGYKFAPVLHQSKAVSYYKKAIKTVGFAKSGYAHASLKLPAKKKQKFQAWITRHPKSNGSGFIKGSGKGVSATLINRVRFAHRLITPGKIEKAIKDNLRNTIKFYDRKMKAESKKK